MISIIQNELNYKNYFTVNRGLIKLFNDYYTILKNLNKDERGNIKNPLQKRISTQKFLAHKFFMSA